MLSGSDLAQANDQELQLSLESHLLSLRYVSESDDLTSSFQGNEMQTQRG
jgi:hypothetical protein